MAGGAHDAQSAMARANVIDDLHALEQARGARGDAPTANGLEPKPEIGRDLHPARAVASARLRVLHDGALHLGRVELSSTGAMGRKSAAKRLRRQRHTPDASIDPALRQDGVARVFTKKLPLAREFGISRETLYQYLRQPAPASTAEGGTHHG